MTSLQFLLCKQDSVTLKKIMIHEWVTDLVMLDVLISYNFKRMYTPKI
jgi:hypothetical protein